MREDSDRDVIKSVLTFSLSLSSSSLYYDFLGKLLRKNGRKRENSRRKRKRGKYVNKKI